MRPSISDKVVYSGKKIAHVTQDWTLGARKRIAWEIEGSGDRNRDSKEVVRYQGSLD